MINVLSDLYEKYIDEIRESNTDNTEYNKLSDEKELALIRLTDSLNKEQRKLLDVFIDKDGLLDTFYEKECFSFAFSLSNLMNKESQAKMKNLDNL